MSEPNTTNHPEPAEPPIPPEDLFNKTELKFFDEEDSHAGNVIGKMLSLFFLYTVFAMALVAFWTFTVVGK